MDGTLHPRGEVLVLFRAAVLVYVALVATLPSCAEQSFAVSGEVATSGGARLQGARVRLYRVAPVAPLQTRGPVQAANPTFTETSSASDGCFVVRDAWAGPRTWEYLLEVTRPGSLDFRGRLVPPDGRVLHVVLTEAAGPP